MELVVDRYSEARLVSNLEKYVVKIGFFFFCDQTD